MSSLLPNQTLRQANMPGHIQRHRPMDSGGHERELFLGSRRVTGPSSRGQSHLAAIAPTIPRNLITPQTVIIIRADLTNRTAPSPPHRTDPTLTLQRTKGKRNPPPRSIHIRTLIHIQSVLRTVLTDLIAMTTTTTDIGAIGIIARVRVRGLDLGPVTVPSALNPRSTRTRERNEKGARTTPQRWKSLK